MPLDLRLRTPGASAAALQPPFPLRWRPQRMAATPLLKALPLAGLLTGCAVWSWSAAAGPQPPAGEEAAGVASRDGIVSAPTGQEPVCASIYGVPDSTRGSSSPGALADGKGQGAPGQPIRLGEGPHLFIDDFLIEASRGFTRRVNRPQRDPALPNPIVTGKEDRCFQPYLTVLRDPHTRRFRLWYGVYDESRAPLTSHIGYMESEDGIHWIRPPRILRDPGPIQFGNSVLDEGPDFPDPARRYKLGWWMDGGLQIATSPDGLEWQMLAPGPVLRHNHDITNIFRDTLRNRFVATVSVYTTGPTWEGQRRVTMQSVSRDLLHWEPPRYILTPVDGIDEGQTQFYAMNGHLIRGGLWIGMVKVLRDDLRAAGTPEGSYGIGYTTLAWTRDGIHWVRDREPFFEPDPQPGAWDHAHAWIDWQLPVGDQVYLYYGGYKNGHKVNRFEERQIGIVRMRRDRYVSRDAGDAQATLRTPPVVLAGARLTLNADAAGEVRVRLCDLRGQPLRGFGYGDCRPITGDSLAHPVRWQGARPVPGRPVRMEFRARRARLYGFDLLSSP